MTQDEQADTQASNPFLKGTNLPGFVATQLDFSAHIRNPEKNPRPSDIEPRRMQIYLDLFFNNVNGFVTSTFPVLKSLMTQERWLRLVRDFFESHPSESPYFLQIAEEFLTFLHNQPQADLPEFILELAHYEWVEMALDVAEDHELPDSRPISDRPGHLLVSPYVRCLSYRFPVHHIGPDHQPDQPGESVTHLIVYRNAQERVRFLEANPLTLRLLQLLADHDFSSAVEHVVEELSGAGVRDTSKLHSQALGLVRDLASKDIILGEL
ncbi:MAG: putative DNA-binding domain-containing protein [Pseudomonadota bacterium]